VALFPERVIGSPVSSRPSSERNAITNRWCGETDLTCQELNAAAQRVNVCVNYWGDYIARHS
jgi:hypothetical protein